MASVLLSGPAGGAKSALARRLLVESAELSAIADFQLVYRALTDVERDRGGRYPLRNEGLLPLTEYVRRAIIGGAVARGITVIATNSDGDPERRAFLLGQWARVRPSASLTLAETSSRRACLIQRQASCRLSAIKQ